MKTLLTFPHSIEITSEAAAILIGDDEISWRDYRQTELAEASYYQAHGLNIMVLTNYISNVTQYFLQDTNA